VKLERKEMFMKVSRLRRMMILVSPLILDPHFIKTQVAFQTLS